MVTDGNPAIPSDDAIGRNGRDRIGRVCAGTAQSRSGNDNIGLLRRFIPDCSAIVCRVDRGFAQNDGTAVVRHDRQTGVCNQLTQRSTRIARPADFGRCYSCEVIGACNDLETRLTRKFWNGLAGRLARYVEIALLGIGRRSA